MMRVLVDADACPVSDLAVRLSNAYHRECILLCDTAHHLEKTGARTLTVSKGADSVDFALVKLVQPGDLVITQDYGLAAMCLARGASVLHQDGMEYTADNMDALLLARHTARKIRASGGRQKGPAKRSKDKDVAFEKAMRRLLMRE